MEKYLDPMRPKLMKRKVRLAIVGIEKSWPNEKQVCTTYL